MPSKEAFFKAVLTSCSCVSSEWILDIKENSPSSGYPIFGTRNCPILDRTAVWQFVT